MGDIVDWRSLEYVFYGLELVGVAELRNPLLDLQVLYGKNQLVI